MTIRPNVVTSSVNICNEIAKEHLFKTMPNETTNKLFYGVELEVHIKALDVFYKSYENDSSIYTTANAAIKYASKRDSIRAEGKLQVATDLEDKAILKPDGHMEIVTVPATLNYHREVLWNQFFKNSAPMLSGPYGCGLHVHFSRDALTDIQLARVILFINENCNSIFLTRIAGRNVSDSSLWQHQKRSETVNVMRKAGTEDILKKSQGTRDAISVSARNSGASVECRIFQSMPTQYGVFKALEFLDALILYCKENGSYEKEMKHEAFLDWFVANRMQTKYPWLEKCLKRLKLVEKETNLNVVFEKMAQEG